MPVGFQLLGRSFQEAQIYQAAHVLHSSLPGMDYPRGLVD
jgi:Asp-tRNA(Asn)/Glu-tRNA(Gln) amidotransferase A subunit family amidase